MSGGLLGDDFVKRLLKGGLVSLGVKIGGAVMSLVMYAALARSMGPVDFGRFGFAFSLGMTVAMMASLGLHTGIMRWRPMYEVAGQEAEAASAERWAFNMTLVAGGLLWAALALGATLFWAAGVAAFFPGGRLDPLLLTAAGGFAAAMAASEFVAGALRARGSAALALAPRDVVWRASVAAVAGIVALTGGNAPPQEMLIFCAGLLAALTVLQCWKGGVRPGAPHGREVPALGVTGVPGGWLLQAAPMWGAALVNVFTRQFEVVLLGLFVTAAETGAYFAALSMAQALMLTLVAANVVAAPMISRLHAEGNDARLQKMLRLVMAGVTPAALAGFAIVALGADLLMSIFDPSYAAQSDILIALAAGATLNALAGPSDPALSMTGNAAALLRIKGTIAGVTLAAQLVLIPTIGIWGAAGPNLAGMLAWHLAARRATRARLGLDPTVSNLIAPVLARIGR